VRVPPARVEPHCHPRLCVMFVFKL
jgi:hypothetical protein